MKVFTKTILLLSLVSLLTDISSEMLYPVMPMFLTSIGFSVVWIGILEGVAEATAGFSKGYFGKLSDNLRKRVPFVQLGYFLSSLSKPLMAFIAHPLWILFCRASDRLGKGIRTSARDAILSSETESQHKGKVFGLHRGADTLGAALGPLAALVFLSYYPQNYKVLFLIAFIPAIAGVIVTFLLKEEREGVDDMLQNRSFITSKMPHFFSFLGYWKRSDKDYKKLVIGLLAFAVVNSSDIFLLLMLKHYGLADGTVIMIYIFYNLVYSLASAPLGWLGDRIGLKYTFISGLLMFVVTYSGIIFKLSEIWFYILFAFYGLYAAATEGISKAWISNIAKREEMATAFGFYTGWQSICTLFASLTAGLMWNVISPISPFIFTASATVLIAVYFIKVRL